jgi:Uma2 family endonuclease
MNPRRMSVSSVPKPPPRGIDLPCDDGENVETGRHRAQQQLLFDSLEEAYRGRTDYFVGTNMFLYFSETQSKRNDFRGPDLFVVLDTEKRERRSWVVWEEGGRTPDVVVELVSESTEEVDRGEKMNVYARILHVSCYVIYDPFTAQLDVFQLDPGRRVYERVSPDGAGRYPCAPLGLSLGVVHEQLREIEAPWLRWFDREGNVVRTGNELVARERDRAAREAERAAREAERAAREAERANRAEAELAKLREELARRGG